MRIEELRDLHKRICEGSYKVLEEKQEPYGKGNRGSNIKDISKIYDMDESKVLLILMEKHLQVIRNRGYEYDKSLKDLEERIKDIINYLIILLQIEKEKGEERIEF